MRPSVLLTIQGVTMSMAEWSRKPGAAKYATICRRLNVYGYEHERAVFGEAKRIWFSPHCIRPMSLFEEVAS